MENLTQRFQELVDLIGRLAVEAKKDRPPLQIRHRKVVVDTTHESPSGISPGRSHYEDVYKPSWHKVQFAIIEALKTQPLYVKLRADIRQHFGEKPNIDIIADSAINLLVSDFLVVNKREIASFVENLHKDINGEPVRSWVECEVRGFEILVPKIEFSVADKTYSFRQRQIADFEREYPDYMNMPPSWDIPSCFLHIEMPARTPADLQLAARQAETVLKLFEVCACTTDGRQSFHSDSVGRFIGGEMSMGPRRLVKAHQLKVENVPALELFWSECAQRIPARFYNFTPENEDFLKIAYDRYCDALFHLGRIEGKIALAAMGLEAIYLGSSEMNELKYRLSLRMAKLFSKIGFDYENVQTCIRVGYDIRSTYVHGGHLSAKDREKFEKKTKLSLDELATTLLNNLRVSILAMVLTNAPKAQTLKLVDDSLLNESRDQELQTLLAHWKPFLTRNPSSVPI
jgi:Apea-like HEPN